MRSHVSARYCVDVDGKSEDQSSSGILVSTVAGSTGWLKSVHAGAARIVEGVVGDKKRTLVRSVLPWDADRLIYVVREPWPSKSTGANVVYGTISKETKFVVASQMAEGGVIFSDGIEADYLTFTAGLTATVRIADKKAQLIVQ